MTRSRLAKDAKLEFDVAKQQHGSIPFFCETGKRRYMGKHPAGTR